MTTLLHFCQLQQSARQVLRPERCLAAPTCTQWVSSIGVLSSDWNCLSGVMETVPFSPLVPVLSVGCQGASEGIRCPWEVRSQLTTPEQRPHPCASPAPLFSSSRLEES